MADNFRQLAINFGSSGGSYKAAIQSALDHDESYPIKEYGADSQVTGFLPSSLDLQYADEGTRLKAKAERRDAKLIFEKVEEGKICFVQPVTEKVFDFGDEQRARVERIGRSFSFAAELTGPLNAEAVANRPLAPGPNSSTLEVVEVSGVEPMTTPKGRYLSLRLRRCGPAPVKVNNAYYLTVIVTPTEGVELNSDPYVLVWHLS